MNCVHSDAAPHAAGATAGPQRPTARCRWLQVCRPRASARALLGPVSAARPEAQASLATPSADCGLAHDWRACVARERVPQGRARTASTTITMPRCVHPMHSLGGEIGDPGGLRAVIYADMQAPPLGALCIEPRYTSAGSAANGVPCIGTALQRMGCLRPVVTTPEAASRARAPRTRQLPSAAASMAALQVQSCPHPAPRSQRGSSSPQPHCCSPGGWRGTSPRSCAAPRPLKPMLARARYR